VPLDFIAKPLEQILVGITHLTNNYGLSIILFTILVRLAISPLNLAQLRSARAMSALQPKLKELQKVHGKDRQQLTQATMALYKDHKVNPMAGCLPLLIQLPVLWGLFNALSSISNNCFDHPGAICTKVFAAQGAHNIYHSSFLWLPNLGHPDPFHVLPIVAGVTQWIQTKMMMQPSTDAQQQQMNQIMQFMPLMIVFFAWQYQSGLALYWVVSTLFSIALQYSVNRSSPNGPWGQLPILGAGKLPPFLGGPPAPPRDPKNVTRTDPQPKPRAERPGPAALPRREALRPTFVDGQSVVQPRGGSSDDGAPPPSNGRTAGGPRPRGPRQGPSRRSGTSTKGVRK